MAHERAAAHYEVGARIGQRFIHYEVFLLPAKGRRYFLYILIKILAYIYGRLVERSNGF